MPQMLTNIWLNFLYFVVPYATFFFGVYIGYALKLWKNVSLWQSILMGIPVSLLYVTPIIYTAYDAYTEDYFKLMLLFGNIIVIGTMTPTFFSAARERIRREQLEDKPNP